MPLSSLKLEHWPPERLVGYARNPRKNDAVVDRMAEAIREFGFRIPIVARSDGSVVDGHLRLKAAQTLDLDSVPVVLADDLSEAQIRAGADVRAVQLDNAANALNRTTRRENSHRRPP